MIVYIIATLVVSLWCFSYGFYINDSDLESMMVYYNPKTHKPFNVMSIENILTSNISTKSKPIIRRIGFRSNGCTCQKLTCGCCAGINLQQFNFNREGCMNFTYDPYEFSINMNMLMNGNSVFSNSVSAKNPPPLCIPLPIPYIPLSVEACAKLYDIYTPGQNLHMCFDFETRIQQATALILHFDCMRMGNNGVALVKPGDTSLPTTTETQIDTDIYDKVTEIKYKNSEIQV